MTEIEALAHWGLQCTTVKNYQERVLFDCFITAPPEALLIPTIRPPYILIQPSYFPKYNKRGIRRIE